MDSKFRKPPPAVRSYIGLPYAPLGRTRAGVDCWGLVHLFALEQFAVVLPTYLSGYTNPHDVRSAADTVEFALPRWNETDTPKTGDVVLIRLGGRPSHCGVYIAGATFLHVLAGRASTIERLTDNAWRDRIAGFYQWPT